MKVVGIIAEYNPFHKGHKYQIDALREKTGADYIIIAMSGNFLQRGVPALCDKFSRTRMALENGADLVLELPTLWATASAEYFARGGVELLCNTGVVTHLGFGAESEDMNTLLQVSSILKEEPDVYKDVLANSIRSGNSFPVARKNALVTSLPLIAEQELDKLLNSPNNILALEYLKALPKNISPVLIPRKGAGYHNTDIHAELPSASAIREAIFNSGKHLDLDILKDALPTSSYKILEKLLKKEAVLDTMDFSEMLGYCLLTEAARGFDSYADCTVDLSNKIKKHIKDYINYDSFTHKIKSKDVTYTRASRCLLHILLDIKQGDYSIGKALGYAPYIRVLGFREDSRELLSTMKKNSHSPLITKLAAANDTLDYATYKMLEKDIFTSNLYYQRLAGKSNKKPMNEFTNPIVIV